MGVNLYLSNGHKAQYKESKNKTSKIHFVVCEIKVNQHNLRKKILQLEWKFI